MFVLLASMAAAQIRDPLSLLERRAPAESPADGVRIEVVDPDLEPLAGVSVGFVAEGLLRDPKTEGFRKRIGQLFRNDLYLRSALAAKYGQRYVTDADGVATLPKQEGGYVVAMMRKGVRRYAAVKRLRKGAEDLMIELKALKGEVAVRVVDERGRPVSGLPIAGGVFGDRSLSGGALVAGWTGRDGLGYWSNRVSMVMGPDGMQTIGVPFVGDERISKTFAISAGLPEEVVELKMPSFGQVKILYYDRDGKLSDQVTKADISIEQRFEAGRRYDRWSAPIVDPDGATFPAVALNLHYSVRLYFKGKRTPVIVSGAGPRRPREMVILTAREGELAKGGDAAKDQPSSVVLRVLGPDGEPVTKHNMRILFIDADYARGFSTMTDEAGRLELQVPDNHLDKAGVQVFVRPSTRRPSARKLQGGFRLELPEEIPAGKSDFGDRQLKQEPVRLAGRVVDDAGEPVKGAVVEVTKLYNRRSSSRSGSSNVYPKVTTGADGKFEIRHVFDEIAEIRCQLDGHFVSEAPDWEIGDTDAKFVLGRAGELVVGIADPPESQSLQLVLVDSDGVKLSKYAYARDGKAEVKWEVAPGDYKLYLHSALDENLVADKVTVRSGEVVDDERVRAIDWTKHLSMITVLVVDAAGKRLPQADVMWHVQSGNGWRGSGTSISLSEESVGHLVPAKARVVVRVTADGYAPLLVDNAKGHVKAVMTKLKRLKVSLLGDLDLPEEMAIGIRLTQNGELQKKRREVPIHVSDPAAQRFAGGVAKPFYEGDADCKVRLTLMRAKRPGEYRPKSIGLSHDLPDIELTEAVMRDGVEFQISEELKLEIAEAVEQLRER